jgi:hypothetical protein
MRTKLKRCRQVKIKNGKWKIKNGKWKIKNGKWKMRSKDKIHLIPSGLI